MGTKVFVTLLACALLPTMLAGEPAAAITRAPVDFGAKVGPVTPGAYRQLQTTVGRPLVLTRLYYLWDSKYPADRLTTWFEAHPDRTPIISVKT